MRRVPLHGGRSEVQRLHFGGALWILSAGKGGFGIGCGTRTGKEKLETVRVGSNDEKYTLGDCAGGGPGRHAGVDDGGGGARAVYGLAGDRRFGRCEGVCGAARGAGGTGEDRLHDSV